MQGAVRRSQSPAGKRRNAADALPDPTHREDGYSGAWPRWSSLIWITKLRFSRLALRPNSDLRCRRLSESTPP